MKDEAATHVRDSEPASGEGGEGGSRPDSWTPGAGILSSPEDGVFVETMVLKCHFPVTWVVGPGRIHAQ